MKMKKTAAVLFTGGKDSCLALVKAKKQGYDIKYLLAIIPKSAYSYMYHKPSLKLLEVQAKLLKLPLVIQKSSAGKEAELKDLLRVLGKVKEKVDCLVIGGIASNYQAKRIKEEASKAGLKVVAPLWAYSQKKLWQELLKEEFEVIITKISCEGLGAEWLGKVIDKKRLLSLEKLAKKYKFNLTLEGGDAETAVLSCPLFKKELKIKSRARSESPYRHFLVIENVKAS